MDNKTTVLSIRLRETTLDYIELRAKGERRTRANLIAMLLDEIAAADRAGPGEKGRAEVAHRKEGTPEKGGAEPIAGPEAAEEKKSPETAGWAPWELGVETDPAVPPSTVPPKNNGVEVGRSENIKADPRYVKDPSFDDGEAPAGESQVRGGRRKGK